jgi:cytosine/adenosine deaminase-related metal-dependent hydrolase
LENALKAPTLFPQMAFLCNCHTHIGDAFIRLPQKKWSVEQLVAPPNGYKHRRLRNATQDEVQQGMLAAAHIMQDCGTTHFIDFREGGLPGVQALKSLDLSMQAIVLGRPAALAYDEQELDMLLERTEGIALSGIAEWDYAEIQKIADHVHSSGKLFALHVSEHKRENIQDVLALRPSFMIHLCCAIESDLDFIADDRVPVVVCPRANAFFDLRPPIEAMLQRGISVMLGTDNAMIVPPNIREEMIYVQQQFAVAPSEIEAMVTSTPRKCLNVRANIHEAD